MGRPTRILHVLNYYAPHKSGLTEYARLIAEAFAALGDEITVLTSRHRRDLSPEEIYGGVRVLRAKPLFKLHKGNIGIDFIRSYQHLVKSFDLAHLHLPMLESGVLARLTPASIPLVVTYQCDLAPASRWSPVDRLAVDAVRASGHACCVRAQRILVTSKEYAAGSPVIGNFSGKWVEVFPPDNAPRDLQPRQVSAGGSKVVGFLGRFVEEKGIDVILNAIPLVLDRYPDTHFILAGEHESVPGGSQMGRLRAKLDRLASVSIPGKLPDERLFDFYRSLDVFLLPSINAYEAFGIVQIEAMKAGVPVIASDMRGVRVPVRLTGCGSIVPPGDSRALANAINDWLSSPPPLSPEEIALRANQTFSNRATVEMIRQVYADLLENSRRQQDHQTAERS